MIVRAFNPSTEKLEKSYLTNAISAGVTSVAVQNAQNFTANDRIMLGEMGREKSEVRTVQSVSGNTIVLTAVTSFDHDADDSVYELRYDQVKFYRADTEDGSYSLIATVDIDVDNAALTTPYDDTTGSSTSWYKVTYYHSVSTQESSYSDPQLATGFSRNSVGHLISEFLREVKDENETFVTRDEILGWLNEVNDDLQTRTAKPYDFLKTRTTLTRTANTNYIDFPTDANGNQTMWKFERLEYNYVDATTDPDTNTLYAVRVLPLEEFRDRFRDQTIDSTTVNDSTQYVALDTAMDRFRFYPPFETTSAGVFYLYYWKYFSTLDSDGDEFETPTPRIYKLFCHAQYWRKKSQTDPQFSQTSDRYYGDYSAEVLKLQSHNRKDAGSSRSFSFRPQTNRGWRKY